MQKFFFTTLFVAIAMEPKQIKKLYFLVVSFTICFKQGIPKGSKVLNKD